MVTNQTQASFGQSAESLVAPSERGRGLLCPQAWAATVCRWRLTGEFDWQPVSKKALYTYANLQRRRQLSNLDAAKHHPFGGTYS